MEFEADLKDTTSLKHIAQTCAKQLQKLSQDEETQEDSVKARDGFWASRQSAELNLWCAKIGVNDEGLRSTNVRLKDVPEICELLLHLLQSLQCALHEIQLPAEEHAQIIKADNTLYDEDSDTSSVLFQSLSSSERSNGQSAADNALSPLEKRNLSLRIHIRDTIDRLQGHAMRIEHAGAQHRKKRVEVYLEKERIKQVYEGFKQLGMWKINETFKSASNKIKERTAESFARRRIHFEYLKEHQKKRAVDTFDLMDASATPKPPPDDISDTVSLLQKKTGQKRVNTLGTPCPKDQKTIFSATVNTEYDFPRQQRKKDRAESVRSVALNIAGFPPQPQTKDGKFQCPYCLLEFRAREAEEKGRWRQHIMQDFGPYFCTVEECKAPFDVQNSFDGLLDHLQSHIPVRHHVDGPNGDHEEYIEADFQDRVKSYGEISDEMMDTMKEASRRKGAFLFKMCPFCGGYPDVLEKHFPNPGTFEAQNELRNHIKQHMQEIALFLPPYRSDILDEDDDLKGSDVKIIHGQSVHEEVSGNAEDFLLTCDRIDCDCRCTEAIETGKSALETEAINSEEFWSDLFDNPAVYDRSTVLNSELSEDECLFPFVVRFVMQEFGEAGPDYQGFRSLYRQEKGWPPLKLAAAYGWNAILDHFSDPMERDPAIDLRTSVLPMSGPATHLNNPMWPEIFSCTEGCSKTFGRPYDVRRHIEEQHRCPHPDCKELRLATVREKKEHKKGHSDMGFRCGICALSGLPKSLSRKEKLRKHLVDTHNISDDLDFLDFQCFQPPCFLGEGCGGIYFTSYYELNKHIEHKHVSKPSHDTYSDGRTFRGIASKPLVETVGVGNVAKQQRDQDTELEAKRLKVETSNFDSAIAHNDIARSKASSPVDPPVDSYTYSSHIRKPVEESLELSLIDLRTLTKQEDWESVLQELSSLHLSPVFDSKKAAIRLRGSCSAAELDKGMMLLTDMISQAKSLTLQDDEINISPYTMSRKGFQQQVSVHHQPEIRALDPKEDADTLALWNEQLLREFPDIVRVAEIEGSYSVALVRQIGPDGFQLVIRFRSSGNQGDASRQIIEENVERICVNNGHPILDIQFTEGYMVRLVGGSSNSIMDDPSNDQKFPHERSPWRTPGMGASIGLSRCPHAFATLGGYISIDGRTYMLTGDPFISECNCEVDGSLRSPSISNINDVKCHLRRKLKDLGLKILRSAPDEVPLGQITEHLFPENVNKELEQFKRFFQELADRETGFDLGKIRYRCKWEQLRSSSNPLLAGLFHRMDWSLSEITAKHREGKNFHRHGRVAKSGISDLAHEAMKPEGSGDHCATIRVVAGGEHAFYVSTTSGFREGLINPALIQYGDEYGVSHEWTMIVPHCEALNDSDFQGDSGAWIISNDNKLLGLLWGWDNGNLLFTPIEDVFADIAQKLNCPKVELSDPDRDPDRASL